MCKKHENIICFRSPCIVFQSIPKEFLAENFATCVLSGAIQNQRDGPLRRLDERLNICIMNYVSRKLFFSISLNFFPTTIATMWFWHLMMRLFHHISFCNLEDFNYSNSAPCWHLAIKKICCCASNLFRDYALWNKFQLYAAFLPFKLLNVCACLKTIARLSSKTFKFWDRYSVYQVTLTTRSFLFRRTLILMSKVMSQDGLMKCS